MTAIPIAKPLSSILGVMVENLDVDDELSADISDALRALLAEHYLILFPELNLTMDQQRRLLGVFGPVADERGDNSYYTLVQNRISPESDQGDGLLYHSDYSFMPMPLPVVSLYGVEIPKESARTRFVSGVRACRRLPEALKRKLQDRFVLHASDVISQSTESAGPLRPDELETRAYKGTLHPAIFTHPKTGDSILFINEYLSVLFEGLEREGSDALLAEVFAHLYSPDNVYEHCWRQGDLIIFDNIALQHSRVKGPARTLRRLIVSEMIQ